jgi:hypothetical protein
LKKIKIKSERNINKMNNKIIRKEGNLAFEIVAMPFGFVMKFLIGIIFEFSVTRIAS